MILMKTKSFSKGGWCRWRGTSCDDPECPHEHLKEFPGICDAVLKNITPSGETDGFAMCELEPDHEGPHKALNMAWCGDGVTVADSSDWWRARNLMLTHMKKLISK